MDWVEVLLMVAIFQGYDSCCFSGEASSVTLFDYLPSIGIIVAYEANIDRSVLMLEDMRHL